MLNCLFWVFYGLPVVHPDSTLVITINGIGLALELIYLTIFFAYTGKRNRVSDFTYMNLIDSFCQKTIVGQTNLLISLRLSENHRSFSTWRGSVGWDHSSSHASSLPHTHQEINFCGDHLCACWYYDVRLPSLHHCKFLYTPCFQFFNHRISHSFRLMDCLHVFGSQQKKVVQTKSVEFLPFWLCLAGFVNGIVWFTYANLKTFDLYIAVS